MVNIDYKKLLSIANERDAENEDLISSLEEKIRLINKFLLEKNLSEECIIYCEKQN